MNPVLLKRQPFQCELFVASIREVGLEFQFQEATEQWAAPNPICVCCSKQLAHEGLAKTRIEERRAIRQPSRVPSSALSLSLHSQVRFGQSRNRFYPLRLPGCRLVVRESDLRFVGILIVLRRTNLRRPRFATFFYALR